MHVLDHFLSPADPAMLRLVREELQQTSDVAALFQRHTTLPDRDRFFVLTAADLEVPHEMRDLRRDRLRPVARVPGSPGFTALVLASQTSIVSAEVHARAFATALWACQGLPAPSHTIVWKQTSWGANSSTAALPWIPGFPAILKEIASPTPSRDLTPLAAWVASLCSVKALWDEARSTGRLADVDLIGPFEALWSTGCGLLSINDQTIVLTLNGQKVRTDNATEGRQQQLVRLTRLVQSLALNRLAHALTEGLPHPNELLHTLVATSREQVGRRSQEVLTLLLAAGVEPAATDRLGRLPLSLAAQDPWCCAMMIDGGIPVDTRDPSGRTALLQVCEGWAAPPARHLLDQGADIRAVDHLGWNALHHAACRGSADLVTALLEGGADASRRSRQGLTPRDVAANDRVRALLPEVFLRPPPSRPRLSRALPSGLLEALQEEKPGCLGVLADYLTERGDLRGPALALSLSGQAEASRRLLQENPSAWKGPLAEVHPEFERSVQRWASPALSWEHGFLAGLDLHGPGCEESLEALAALLDHPEGALVRSLRIGPVSPKGVAAVTAIPSALVELTLLLSEPLSTLDLDRWPRLRHLEVRGPGFEELSFRSRSLRRLILNSPRRPDSDAGAPLGEIIAPHLAGLAVTMPRVVEPGHLAAMNFPGLTSLSLRPMGERALAMLLEHPVLDGLEKLSLLSMFRTSVEVLRASPERLMDLELTISLVDAHRLQREQLQEELDAVFPRVKVKGASYRALSGY